MVCCHRDQYWVEKAVHVRPVKYVVRLEFPSTASEPAVTIVTAWNTWPSAAAITSPVPMNPPNLHVCRVPLRARQYYTYLHDQKKYSDLTLVAALLAVPVVIGERRLTPGSA